MEFNEAVRARRSIRHFQPQDIPDDVLADVLDAGRLAPSPGGTDSFLFGVVKDGPTKAELAKAAGGQEWVAAAPVVIALCARLGNDLAAVDADDPRLAVNQTRFGSDLIAYLNAFPDRQAVRVLVDNGTPLTPGENVTLAAASHHLGSCWVGILDTREAARILHLPDDLACLFLMVLGYPAETPKPRTLRPIEECVFYDRWGTGR